jgi:hypothetical protein
MSIKSIKVTRTFCYSPESYLEWCEEEGTTPTQAGFLEFIKDGIYEDMASPLDLNLTDYIEEIEE